MSESSLPDILVEALVRESLREDLGRAGDITSDAVVPPNHHWSAALRSRQGGVVAGISLARVAFSLMDHNVEFQVFQQDGDLIKPGSLLATVKGRTQALLAAERVALNFLCHLSGIASLTLRYVEAVKPHKCKISCTRKTTPLLRACEKYAVRLGGGVNHRFGLDDAILIKDNHIAVAGSITHAVDRALARAGHLVKIEVEVDTLDQLRECLPLPIHAVLLDNMDVATLHQAIQLVEGRFTTEASGRVNLETVNAIAATGVDVISIGALTHSAPILDIGLDALP